MVSGEHQPLSPSELEGRWNSFFEESDLRRRIVQIAEGYPAERSLHVAFPDIDGRDSALADNLLHSPEGTLKAGEKALTDLLPESLVPPTPIHLRITGLPLSSRIVVHDLRQSHLNRFVAIEGIVRRMTEVRPQIVDAVFECAACRDRVGVEQEEGAPSVKEPVKCDSCGKPVGKTRFTLLPEASRYIDSQKIEIQENPEKLKGGTHPEALPVILLEDLTGGMVPGHRLIINGRLKSTARLGGMKGAGRPAVFDLTLLANSIEKEDREYAEIEITAEDQLAIEAMRGDKDLFNRFVDSLAPSILGMRIEKEAIALQLFGGVPKIQPDGIHIRGDIHALLVGDPGCLIGDERIVMANGTVVKLENLGDYHLEPIHARVQLGPGMGRTALATRFHRYLQQPIMEVLTESGKCIRGTLNHPLLVSVPHSRKSEWRRLDELKAGDRVVVSESIQCRKTTLVATGWSGPEHYPKSRHGKVPKFYDEELASIMGYVLGAGWVRDRRIGYSVALGAIDDLPPKLEAMFQRVFDAPVRRERRVHGRAWYEVARTPVAHWLGGLKGKRVPDAIFASPNRVAAAFLRWLYEADGDSSANGRGNTSVSLRSIDLELLRDVQILLLRWGIQSRILWGREPTPHPKDGAGIEGGPYGTLMIPRGESIERFARHVGFADSAKSQQLQEVVRYVKLCRREGSLRTEGIVSVRRVGKADVYDIEVPGAHRFIANGIISHNTAKSQLLRYVAEIAPRGIYTSGKGATAAGLTAAAVKDDFGGGRWTLEAGAMVLADMGFLAIDELDKMSPNDRSSLHEGLEQQQISVAKAGITATLKARCPVLAAANPKLGRFSGDKTPAEEIDLPPTLLSRFDIIFAIEDKPDTERDRSRAGAILDMHVVAEERESARSTHTEEKGRGKKVGDQFEPGFMRKYVAYAKQHVFPVMEPAANKMLLDFFVNLRKQGEGEHKPVPITLRQVEGLVRLTEASARARLSPVATVGDAHRAILVMEHFLKSVVKSGSGGLDIDYITVGTSASFRDRIGIIRDIMRRLQEGTPEGFTAHEVVERAAEKNISKNEAERLMHEIKRLNEVYEPKPGKLKLME